MPTPAPTRTGWAAPRGPFPQPPAPPRPDGLAAVYRRRDRARLLARIYQVFPLTCPDCGGDMRILAFITSRRIRICS